MTARHVWILVGVLAVLHWDFWWWDNKTLVFGFMPIGLLYHACFSCAAALTWALAVRYAWPDELEAWADQKGDG
ncbi:MAG: DUF3311 domain-containing protein [bacterium]|nr:DUF3311 domain-containing protein [bacterium]